MFLYGCVVLALSKRLVRRGVLAKDWVNLGWSGLLILVLVIYWINNPSFLREFIDLLTGAVTSGRIVLPEVIINVVFLLAVFLAIRFVALMVVSAVEKDYPLTVGNVVYAIISLALGHIFNVWSRNPPSIFEALNTLLIILSFYMISNGTATGWFYKNKLRILRGDWSGVVRGFRIFILGLFFQTNETLLLFQGFTVFLVKFFLGMPLDPLSYTATFLAFLEICLFTLLLTGFFIGAIFSKCNRCGILFLKIGVPVSSWDSEHTFEHRHCPRCGAVCSA